MRKVPSPGKTVAFSPRQFRAASDLARIGGSEDLLICNHGGKKSHRNGNEKSDDEAEDAQKIDSSQNQEQPEIRPKVIANPTPT